MPSVRAWPLIRRMRLPALRIFMEIWRLECVDLWIMEQMVGSNQYEGEK